MFKVPYKSQSHDLNEFYRTTAERLAGLESGLINLESSIETIVAMLNTQVTASVKAIESLTASTEVPILLPDGTMQHPIPAQYFTTNSRAIFRGGVVLTEPISEESKIFASLSDGSIVFPSSARVEVYPAYTGSGFETDPYGAVKGGLPWWRKIPAAEIQDSKACATYTITIPPVFDSYLANEIRFTTFPSVGVKVEEISLQHNGKWEQVDGKTSSDEGTVICLFNPTSVSAVRIGLSCSFPVNMVGKEFYNLGLAEVDVLYNTIGNVETRISADVKLKGNTPFTIKDVNLDCWPDTSWKWTIECRDVIYDATDLPITVHDSDITITVSAEPTGIRGMFKKATLYY